VFSGSCRSLRTQICVPEPSSHDMAPFDEVPGLEPAVWDGASLRAACEAVAARTGFTVSCLAAAYHRHRGDPGHVHGNSR